MIDPQELFSFETITEPVKIMIGVLAVLLILAKLAKDKTSEEWKK